MMGHRQVEQAALFYEFSLEKHVPPDHLLRSIDRFVELDEVRRELADFYSHLGRPSIDPEPMIRMLIVGYCFGIRSERRLCEEVHLNLAYRWFCRLGLDGQVPDHSTFSKNRHGRFRESDLFRRVFETVLRRCIRERLVGGEGFAVDASLIKADANRQTFTHYVIRQRLDNAYRLLRDQRCARRSITSIAYDVGFNDLSYFNRAFCRQFQVTPSDIRNKAILK
jgi:transposase